MSDLPTPDPHGGANKAPDRVDELVRLLRGAGYRLTPQRLAVMQTLAESRVHPSAEDVYETLRPQFPTMSRATVYKTLSMLKREGEILELGFSELGNCYDINRPYPHTHVVCIRCGAVMDAPDQDMSVNTRVIQAATGFSLTGHRLDFYGLCPACQKE